MNAFFKFRKVKKYIIFLFSISYIASSCVVNKPDASSVSYPDYNTRRIVSDAHYHKKLSYTGITLTIGGVAIGAAAGYNTKMVTIQNGENTTLLRPANAFIGALVGYSVASLVNYSFGLNKTFNSTDQTKWLSDANKNLILVPSSVKYNNFTTIVPSTEFSFTIKNIQDARDFASTFPKSTKNDDVMKSAIENCTRDNMPELISLFPYSKYVLDAKTAYIQRSNTYGDLSIAVYKYPEVKIDVESKFAGLVRDITNASDFIERYPNSNLKKTVVINAFNTADQSITEILKLKKLYPNDFYLNSTDEIVTKTSEIRKNYYRALYKLENPLSIVQLENFYNNYSWLNYNEKSDDIISNYWKITNNNVSDGNFILYLMNDIATNETYKNWGITKYAVDKFVEIQLQNEVKNNIIILSTKDLGSTNDEWDKWCNNKTYTAGLVSEKGKIQYIVYGEIKNNSKFDLPIVITAGTELLCNTSLKGNGGWLSNLLSNFINSNTNTVQKLGSTTNNFYIPSLPAFTIRSYAVLLDFGEGTIKSGINLADWIKIKSEIYNSNTYTNTSYYNNLVSNSVLEEQQNWLYLAQNGLPNTTLVDLWRGGEVKNTEWNQKWEDIKEARRIAAIEYQKNLLNYSSSNISSSLPCTITVKSDGTTAAGRPYYVATISNGKKTINCGFYYRNSSAWQGKEGYYEYNIVEYEDYLGETIDEAKKKLIEINCEKINN